MSMKIQRIRGSVQNYGWGRVGSESAVAKVYAANSGSTVDPKQPYAEFWMGTHESGPSFVKGNEEKFLKNWILENPCVLGDKVVQKWGRDVPFLFKVLSVAKPLSIQAHPDKELAKELHKLKPGLYKDDNHKPEMALALTQFEALCGFLKLTEMKEVIRNVPEIEDLVSSVCTNQVLNVEEGDAEKIKGAVKSLFAEIMGASKERVSEVVTKLKSRLKMQDNLTSKEQLVLRLEEQYPKDVGVMAALLMNYVKLQPGEALYLGPNEPHAYVSGDCMECMATSDNVVRAGLTPKERDVATLCSMLTYKLGYPEALKGVAMNDYTTRYRPLVEEFEVDRCIIPEKESAVFPGPAMGPSIIVVMDGHGEILTSDDGDKGEAIVAGDVLFVPADLQLNIRFRSASPLLHLYRAGVNSSHQ